MAKPPTLVGIDGFFTRYGNGGRGLAVAVISVAAFCFHPIAKAVETTIKVSALRLRQTVPKIVALTRDADDPPHGFRLVAKSRATLHTATQFDTYPVAGADCARPS